MAHCGHSCCRARVGFRDQDRYHLIVIYQDEPPSHVDYRLLIRYRAALHLRSLYCNIPSRITHSASQANRSDLFWQQRFTRKSIELSLSDFEPTYYRWVHSDGALKWRCAACRSQQNHRRASERLFIFAALRSCHRRSSALQSCRWFSASAYMRQAIANHLKRDGVDLNSHEAA